MYIKTLLRCAAGFELSYLGGTSEHVPTAIGRVSGIDFHKYCQSISQLDGGGGWHFVVDHKVSIPNLYARVMEATNGEGFEHA